MVDTLIYSLFESEERKKLFLSRYEHKEEAKKSWEDLLEKLEQTKLDYLRTLPELVDLGLINPCVYRELTPKGQSLVKDSFSKMKDLEEKTLDENLERHILRIHLFGLSNREDSIFRISKISEMDRFIYEVYSGLVQFYYPENKSILEQYGKEHQLDPKHILISGAIYVVGEGVKRNLLEVNPPGMPNNHCHLVSFGNLFWQLTPKELN